MGGPVGRAELLRPQARQRLHLVAAGEKRQLGRIGGANAGQPRAEQLERFVPFDLDKVPLPRSLSGRRLSGLDSRAGEYCFMMPAAPLAQMTPRLTGWLRLPWMKRSLSPSSVTLIPQRPAHM